MSTEKPGKSVPKYVTVKRSILEMIESGQYKPGDLIGTEKEFLKLFPVSAATVRRAIEDLVRDGLLERRRGQGTFVVEPSPRENKFVAAILPQTTNNNMVRVLTGIQATAAKRGYGVMVLYYAEGLPAMMNAGAQAVEQGALGLLVWPAEARTEEQHAQTMLWAKRTEEEGCNIVAIDRYLGPRAANNEFTTVVTNNFDMAYIVTCHIIETGHRRVAFVYEEPACSTVEDRRRGFLAAMQEQSLAEEAIVLVQEPLGESGNRLRGPDFVVDQCLERDVTGVFLVCDSLAAALLAVINHRRIDVPGRIAIAGFDDEDFSPFLHPPLTTVRQPFKEEGMLAAKLLIDQLEGVDTTRRTAMLGSALIKRESCGEKASADRV